MKYLSLIVLNYNSYIDTISCVKKLLSFDSEFNIIIVDNNSSDESAYYLQQEFANNHKVSILLNTENKGYSAGNNVGIRYAIEKFSSRVIGILNPDVIIPNIEVIEKMYESIYSDSKIGVIGASAITRDKTYKVSNSAWSIPTKKDLVLNHILFYKKNKEYNLKMISEKLAQVDCIAGCFFLAKVDILLEIGLLDENVFLYNEENILGAKLKKRGYIEVLQIDQFYYHNHNYKKGKKLTLKEKLNTTKYSYKSRKYLCKSFYPTYLLLFLGIAELLNKFYLCLAYIKGCLIKRD